MAEWPVDSTSDQFRLNNGGIAFAAPWTENGSGLTHTHSFVEIAVILSGEGVHHSLAGKQALAPGDVFALRPGVWHGYEECRRLTLYNCGISTELLRHELAWTREDQLLGYLLWTGPYAGRRRGMLTTHLDKAALHDCVIHLEALDELRQMPIGLHRGDIIGRLSLFLSRLARAVLLDGGDEGQDRKHVTHPAVAEAMDMMEARPAYAWTLAELSDRLHLAPRYLVRLFKAATGLPPIAYLSQHRIELAAERLLQSDDPISRIGESVGWPDPNYFARRFRTHYGVTASVYRARFTDNSVLLPSWQGPQKRRSTSAGQGQ